nr:zonular occludens toxin domain-containing protein [Escherichia coli]
MGDKDRQPVIDWFLHARKLGWDIIFLIQIFR